MFKKLKIILGIIAVGTLCAGLAACSRETELEKYQKQGYDITVTYDLCGGKYYDRTGVSVVRMFKSADYMQDGKAEIKLSDPSDVNSALVPSMTAPQSFFAGWYRAREVAKSSDGTTPINYDGEELVEKEGEYYLKGTENTDNPVISYPKYTYSGYWNFETDRFTVEEGADAESKSLTLYAGWVPYFEFNYLYNFGDGWKSYGTTSFNYIEVQENPLKSDKDEVFLPVWSEGKMTYQHTCKDNNNFEFPDLNAMDEKIRPDILKGKKFTFKAAYEDADCTVLITDSLKHGGTFDKEQFKTENPVKNIYVVFDDFEKHIISTPKQLIDNASPEAHYELLADLDFEGSEWPAALARSEFKGEFISKEGNTFTVSNAKATISGSELGGLFGKIGDKAVIKNVTFKDAVLDIARSASREYSYGLLSGEIAPSAQIENVTVGGMVKVTDLYVPETYSFNLLAGGEIKGVTNTGITLRVCGNPLLDGIYDYSVQPEKTQVDEQGNATFVSAVTMSEKEKNKEYFDIISLWRQNNEQ